MTTATTPDRASLRRTGRGDDPASAASSFSRILDALERLASQGDTVRIGEVADALGPRGYGPFLLVPALFEISPIGAIPGIPTLLAAVIVLFAAQILFGRSRLWIPGFVERAKLPAGRVRRSVRFMRPLAMRLDRWFHGRLRCLTQGVFVRVAAVCCVALACTVPLLEIVPFLSSVPMAAIALFGLALLVRDGALMLVATGSAIATAWALLAIG